MSESLCQNENRGSEGFVIRNSLSARERDRSAKFIRHLARLMPSVHANPNWIRGYTRNKKNRQPDSNTAPNQSGRLHFHEPKHNTEWRTLSRYTDPNPGMATPMHSGILPTRISAMTIQGIHSLLPDPLAIAHPCDRPAVPQRYPKRDNSRTSDYRAGIFGTEKTSEQERKNFCAGEMLRTT